MPSLNYKNLSDAIACAKMGMTVTLAIDNSRGKIEKIIVLPVTDSTMNRAEDSIRAGDPINTIIIALKQTAGRGSGDKKWESGNDNLMFSRLIKVSPGQSGQKIEIIAICAVAEVLRELLPEHKITLKYPNDILVDGKKISGCLVPLMYDLEMHKERMIVLGVGVNLATAPSVPGRETTSLADLGIVCGIASFMIKFEEKFTTILSEYHTQKKFNDVLKRAGFLNQADMLTVWNKTHNALGYPLYWPLYGQYGGFLILKNKEKLVAYLCVKNTNKLLVPCQIHTFILGDDPLPEISFDEMRTYPNQSTITSRRYRLWAAANA